MTLLFPIIRWSNTLIWKAAGNMYSFEECKVLQFKITTSGIFGFIFTWTGHHRETGLLWESLFSQILNLAGTGQTFFFFHKLSAPLTDTSAFQTLINMFVYTTQTLRRNGEATSGVSCSVLLSPPQLPRCQQCIKSAGAEPIYDECAHVSYKNKN